MVSRDGKDVNRSNIHWVDSPEDQSEAGDSGIESLSLAVLVGGSSTTVHSELVDDDEVSNASPGVPSPLLAVLGAIGSKETSKNHDKIGNNSNQDAGTVETCEETEIQKKKWCGKTPVNVSCIVNLTVDSCVGVWKTVLVLMCNIAGVEVNSVTSSHGEVG